MSVMKVMVVFALAVAVAMAADSTTADASNVVGSLLAAKTRLPAVNVTLNASEPANSTAHKITPRNLRIDKSEGKSQIMSVFWRIPMAIWRFVYDVLLSPLLSSFDGLLSLFGLSGQQFVNTLPTTQAPFVNLAPQLTTPMADLVPPAPSATAETWSP